MLTLQTTLLPLFLALLVSALIITPTHALLETDDVSDVDDDEILLSTPQPAPPHFSDFPISNNTDLPEFTDNRTITSNVTTPFHIAIVGGGLSGASLAYFLQATPPSRPIQVTVFDTDERPGGRILSAPALASENDEDASKKTVELGSSFFLADNAQLVALARKLQLPVTNHPFPNVTDSSDPTGAGLWDGQKFIWRVTASTGGFDFRGMWRQVSIAFRYGLRTHGKVRKVVRKVLTRMATTSHIRYTSLEDLAIQSGLQPLLERSAFSYFTQVLKVPVAYVREVVGAATRGTIGMEVQDVHALGAMISMAPLASVGLRGIIGGNQRMVRALIHHSMATFRGSTHVESIERVANPGPAQYRLGLKGSGETVMVDGVVLATPLANSHLLMEPKAFEVAAPSQMVSQHVTLVHGFPRPEYFFLSGNKTVPTSVITAETASRRVPFLSFTVLARYPDKSATIKIISRLPLPQKTLQNLFAWWDASTLVQRQWTGAWTDMSPKSWASGKAGKVQLDDSFWYLGGVGLVADCMEASVLAAKNAHALIYRQLAFEPKMMMKEEVKAKK